MTHVPRIVAPVSRFLSVANAEQGIYLEGNRITFAQAFE